MGETRWKVSWLLNEPWFWRIYIAALCVAAIAMRVTGYELPAVARSLILLANGVVIGRLVALYVLSRRYTVGAIAEESGKEYWVTPARFFLRRNARSYCSRMNAGKSDPSTTYRVRRVQGDLKWLSWRDVVDTSGNVRQSSGSASQ